MSVPNRFDKSQVKTLLLYRRWPWHVLFWIGYALFRAWVYYITVKFYPAVFLEYMLLSETLFVGATYFTLWLYKHLFVSRKYLYYFMSGAATWILYLCGRTLFQLYYLQNEKAFRGSSFGDILINNITIVIVSFLFITGCKFFKDGYIAQQFEAEKKEQHLLAEVNNLRSQIAPHFLFNTLNNLYGLAVEKSDKLPALMLQLSDLLRHSLYENQKPLVPISDEITILKNYVQLESLRLEDDLQLKFENNVTEESPYQIVPLILIVFMENAFKHAKFVQSGPICIGIQSIIENDWFSFTIRNNYNQASKQSVNGIGLTNVKRRLEVLYPNGHHHLSIRKDDKFFEVHLKLQLSRVV